MDSHKHQGDMAHAVGDSTLQAQVWQQTTGAAPAAFSVPATSSDGPCLNQSAAGDSRGLSQSLGGAANTVHKVEMAAHQLMHPAQAIKHHTDKVKHEVKAKIAGKVNHLVDKVLP